MTPAELLALAKDLPLKETLSLIASHGIYDVGKKGFEGLRELIRNKNSEKKFGFVPKKAEFEILLKVREKSYFIDFNKILPNHKYADLIRTGYLLSSLCKAGSSESRARIKEIKESIAIRTNGAIQIKIVNLVTTGAIVPVIDYLNELKRKKYDTNYLTDALDEIINDWNKYTIFVKRVEAARDQYYEEREIKVESVIGILKNKMQNKQKVVLLFASGSAIIPAVRAVAKFRMEYPEINSEYFYESKNNEEGGLDVHSSSFVLLK